MEQKQKTSPRDFFLHLLSIATLYACAISFLTLVFQYLNAWLPTTLEQNSYFIIGAYTKIRWAIATLFIVYPTYFFTMRFLKKEYVLYPEKREARVRKWLIYLTLFITALTIIGTLVTLLFKFLEGDTTLRFFLKTISVFFVAGSIFGYYYAEMRNEKKGGTISWMKYLIGGVSTIVLAMMIIGAFRVGSPKEERMRKNDDRRIQDLQVIQNQLLSYWISTKKLPDSLSQIEDPISGFIVPRDPETNIQYEYFKKDDLAFSLCAQFSTNGVVSGSPAVTKPMSSITEEVWEHTSGHFCFERTVNKELYEKNQRP